MNTQAIQAASELSVFDMTKDQRQSFVVKIVEAIEAGYNPLKIHYRLKVIEKVIEMLNDNKTTISKRYRELLLLEAAKHGREFDYGNSHIDVRETGVKYDWSRCGDQELAADMALMEALKEKIKRKQEMLKTIPASGMQTIVEDEVVTLYPPTKTSTTALTLTLK